jgi:hypothetical protein
MRTDVLLQPFQYAERVQGLVSTLADWVGASAATLTPLVDAIRRQVFAAERSRMWRLWHRPGRPGSTP